MTGDVYAVSGHGRGHGDELNGSRFSGTRIPQRMKKLHLDPVRCSSMILTIRTDVMECLAFPGSSVIRQYVLLSTE